MATNGDKLVLEAIFNPFLTDVSFNDDDDGYGVEETKPKGQTNEEFQAANELERLGIELAEKGDIINALSQFNKAIGLAPEKASCFNNRAQAFQLDGNIPGALEDIELVISLTDGKGVLAGKAYCQRAIIKRFLGQEEESLDDFKKASALGNSFAKSQLVKLNPYAALCNQMLSEMMNNVTKGIRESRDN